MQNGREQYQAYAIKSDGLKLVPIEADSIRIELGNDSTGRPLHTVIELRPEGVAHKVITIASYPDDYKDFDNMISLQIEHYYSHQVSIAVSYRQDTRSPYDHGFGLPPEDTYQSEGEVEYTLSTKERRDLAYMFSHSWDGVTQSSTLRHGWDNNRKRWAAAVQTANWKQVITLLNRGANPNDWQLSGATKNTPLHWAAEAAAPIEVVQAMLDLGAWRTIKNAAGERPVDIARRYGHAHLFDLLEPVILHPYPIRDMEIIQEHFWHFLQRMSSMKIHQLRCPELSILMELQEPQMSFRIPGMYGGENYKLDTESSHARLVIESYSSMASSGGSAPRREITVDGCRQIESVREQ
ncbi:ankyrin repeat domain-containing protein [Undibacterium pigrum]|nr:ankyrin repeat domain-containing protein [Undibacterium pigrum]